VTSIHPELQNGAGGTLKPIKLIGMNSRFAKIHEKAQEQKWLGKLNNCGKFEKKKITYQPCSQLRDLMMTDQIPWTT
jgi:hypothetical protein